MIVSGVNNVDVNLRIVQQALFLVEAVHVVLIGKIRGMVLMNLRKWYDPLIGVFFN